MKGEDSRITQTGPPSGDFRALRTAAVFGCILSFAVIFTIIPASLNAIKSTYRSSGSELGWLYWIMMTGFLVATPAAGRYSDRKGKYPVLVAGTALMAAGVTVVAWTSSFGVMLAAALLMGLGGGLTEGVAMAAAADLYAGSRRTAVLNYTQVVFAVGAIACPLAVAQLLKYEISWRYGFVGAAVVCAASAVLTFAARCKRREAVPDYGPRSEWRDLIRNRTVLLLSLGILLYVGSESGTANWLALYFKRDLSASAVFAPWSVGVFWLGISAGRIAAACGSKHLADYALIKLSIGLAIVFQILLLLMHSPLIALGVVFMLGFFDGPVWPTILSRAGTAFPTSSGTVFGIVVAAGGLGAAAFSPMIGGLADGFGHALRAFDLRSYPDRELRFARQRFEVRG